MEYPVVKLKNVCTKIGSGATPRGGSKVYIENGISLIRSQNVYNLKFSGEGLAFISEEAAKKLNGVTIKKNDVLLNITGDSVARTCLVSDNVLPARVNQHVSIIRTDDKKLNPKFLSYYLASPYMQSYMLGLAVGKGASRNAMTKNIIEEFNVPCPSLDYQQCIVDILHNYDKLIENNKKQIKLLEEAAQRLYKEWFIDFRFPGFKNAVNKEDILSSWTSNKLFELFDYVRGKSYTSKEISDSDGMLMANLKNISPFGGYLRNNEKHYFGKYNKNQLLMSGDIIMGVTDMTQERRLVGHVALVPDLKQKLIFSMDLIKLVPKNISKAYLYSLMRYGRVSNYISQHANGVNVLHLRPEIISNIQIKVAPKYLQDKYEEIFNLYHKKIENLEQQNILLQEARDRLLPKLMNGEIEV